MLRRVILNYSLLVFLLINFSLHARVTRVEISSRRDVLGGKTFGEAGAYERIVGRVYFSIRVANPHNQRIVDLALAENLKDGEVEFSADFVCVRPKDSRKGNGSMLLEVPNRGHPRILSLVDGGDEDLGEGRGRRVVPAPRIHGGEPGLAVGCDGADAQKIYAPIAKENGKTITGLLRGDLMPPKVMGDDPAGPLLLRTHWWSRVSGIGAARFPQHAHGPRYAGRAAHHDSPQSLGTLPGWSTANWFPAAAHSSQGGISAWKDLRIRVCRVRSGGGGCGFAAIRDFASYAKRATDAVTPAARVYGEGISQNGRFLRDLLYQGFNADEDGRMALDGVLAHVAGAGRGSFNYRFAQPSRDAQPTSSIFFPTDIFPFTDQPETDPVSGETPGLLDRATKDKVVPKIFFSNTSYEYWGRVAALIHVTADGKRDADVSDQVRIYHFTGSATLFRTVSSRQGRGRHAGTAYPVAAADQVFLAVDDCEHGRVGPQWDVCRLLADIQRSRIGTLVPFGEFSFPVIPGSEPAPRSESGLPHGVRSEICARDFREATAESRRSVSGTRAAGG